MVVEEGVDVSVVVVVEEGVDVGVVCHLNTNETDTRKHTYT